MKHDSAGIVMAVFVCTVMVVWTVLVMRAM